MDWGRLSQLDTPHDVSPFDDVDYAKELLRAMIPLKKKWGGLATTRVADDPKSLDLLRRSGCQYLLLGFGVHQSAVAQWHRQRLQQETRLAGEFFDDTLGADQRVEERGQHHQKYIHHLKLGVAMSGAQIGVGQIIAKWQQALHNLQRLHLLGLYRRLPCHGREYATITQRRKSYVLC